MGPGLPWELYRVPAWVAGTLSIPLAFAVGRERSELGRLATAFLTAASFTLGQDSSKARGYALAVAFCRAVHLLLERHL
jgi:hypothetical protein